MSQMLQMAQVFVSKSGSNIGCHVAQIFIDIHNHQPETADGLAYLWCIVGNCLTLFPTFLRSSENTMSGVRSKNPISRRQLVPHLQWNRPMNRCFILRPQFGQICLLASIKIYWSLAIISSADIPQDKVFFCDEVTLKKNPVLLEHRISRK